MNNNIKATISINKDTLEQAKTVASKIYGLNLSAYITFLIKADLRKIEQENK